jgi:putative endonuclease
MNSRQTGTEYERKAERFLRDRGYVILARNFRCAFGEIDLVAREGNCLVFVEIKYRRTRRSGFPEEAVSLAKQRRICRVADYYRLACRVGEQVPCRFDVIAIEGGELRHHENAFAYLPC